MKRFRDFTENITEEEYRASKRISYSFLKEFSEKGPSVILDGIPEVSTKYLTLGSVVDKLLTEPNYDPTKEYYVTDVVLDLSKSTHSSKIIGYLIDNKITDVDFNILREICSTLEFKRLPDLKDSNLWKQINVVTRQNKGEQIITSNELELAYKMADSFKNHKFTKEIFLEEDDYFEDVEILNQAKIFFKLYGVECKVMSDKIIINHDKKIITPIDIKTGSFFNFLSNFYKYKYYLQAPMYHAAIQSIVVKEFPDYKVDGFSFAYISRERPDLPLLYKLSDKEIEKAFVGWTNSYGIYQKGVQDLIRDYSWHIENDEYTLSRDLIENNGVTNIIL